MRITSAQKERTRERILERARELFLRTGYASCSTREIAAAAGIAAGTLFNYFPSKEALAMTLVGQALEAGRAENAARHRGDEELAEELFALTAAEWRALEPYRAFLPEVLEAALSPFASGSLGAIGEAARTSHLEQVQRILERHGRAGAQSLVSLHLYWTLYLGALAFWTRDESPHAAESLAFLDQTTRIFATALEQGGSMEASS